MVALHLVIIHSHHGQSLTTSAEVAKDSDASVSTRLSATKDAAGDKIDETKHDNKAELNKQEAKH